MGRAGQLSGAVAVAALVGTLVAPATAVDIGPAPGACPAGYENVGPYPANHAYCVRTSAEYGSLSVDQVDVGDKTEFTLSLSLSHPRCVGLNGPYPCVSRTGWGVGDATGGSGPSYRLVTKDRTFFRLIGTKQYYYIPFITQSLPGNDGACPSGSISYATSCKYRVVYRDPPVLGPVPESWGVWIMNIDVTTSATTSKTVWLEAASHVRAQAVNQGPSASFTWEPRDDDPLTIDLDASASSDDTGITSYAWDFGDGTTGSGGKPFHTYAEGGSYLVRLTVTDAQGETDSDTTTVAVNQMLSAELDGAQAAVQDLFELELRVKNNGKLTIDELIFPEPPVGLRVLDTVDPGQVKGELLLDLGPVPPLPTSLEPGETKTVRYRLYPSAVGQVWLTTQITGVDTDGGEHEALAAGVVTIRDQIPTFAELEDVAYYAIERVLEEGRRGSQAVSAAFNANFVDWIKQIELDPNAVPPPTEFQRRVASLFPGLTPTQREELARYIPADPDEAWAMYLATQQGLWDADKRIAGEFVAFGEGAWKFGTGGPRVWKQTGSEILSAAKNGKAALDGAITKGMTPLFTYTSASDEDKARMEADAALAIDALPAQAQQTIDDLQRRGLAEAQRLAQEYKNDKVGFTRRVSAEKSYWEGQAAIAILSGGVGSGLTQAATKAPKLLALLKVVGGGNVVKGASRVQAVVDTLDLLSPIVQPGTQTDVPLLEDEYPDGITQYEADEFIKAAAEEEAFLRSKGYDVQIGIGAAQASPESAVRYQEALEAHKADPRVPLPPPKGEALKDFKSLGATDVALGCPPDWAGFTGVYKPKLPEGYELLPQADRKALLERAQAKLAEYDAYQAFKSGNPQSKASKVLAKANAPGGGTFDLDFERTEHWSVDFNERTVNGDVGALFIDRRTGTGIIADIDIVNVFDLGTGKALPAGVRAQTDARIKAKLQKRGVRLADHGWQMNDLRMKSEDLKAAYRARLERMDPKQVNIPKMADQYAERINELWNLAPELRMTGKDLLKGARLGRKTIVFSRRLLPKSRLAPLAEAAVEFTVDSPADAADSIVGDGLCAAAGGGCTLRAAVQEAGAATVPARVVLPAGRYVLAKSGASEDLGATGDLDVRGDLTIAGAGAATTTIDAAELDRVLDVQIGAALTLSGTTLTRGVADNDGGAIRCGRGRLALTGVVVQGNVADGHGGGVSVSEGSVTLSDVTFDDNGGRTGGGLSAIGAAITIDDSRFTNNSAEAGGGAGILFTPGLSVTDTTFAHNTAISDGGGLWIQGVSATDATLPSLGVTNCTFTENDGGERGGAVAITHLGAPQGDGDITIGSSSFAGNVADRGGAVDTDPDLTTVDGCTFEDNRARREQGGAVAAVGPLHIVGSRFSRNRAEGDGGAVNATDETTVDGSTFEDNVTASFGGAIATSGPTQIDGSTFARNQGDDNGGALALTSDDLAVLLGSTLTDNHSDGGRGGAIYRAAGPLQIGGNQLSGNTPLGDGDGIHYAFGGSLATGTACSADAQCDDGDACTQGACSAGQCVHTPLGGFAGADCLLGKVLAADACAGETVHAKLAKALGKGVAKARATLARAEAASGKKRAKLVKKARAQIAGLTRKVRKSKKTPEACRATLAGYLGAPLQVVEGLAP